MLERIELLKKLCEAFGPSGHEDDVRDIVEGELRALGFDPNVDSLGNIVVYAGNRENAPTIILDAHMDEVGLLITHIDKEGFLRFEILGGIDGRILLSQRVKIRTDRGFIHGVIGAKAPHLLSPEERTKVPQYRSLFIDIGASSRDEAIDMGVSEGSMAVFDTPFVLQGSRILGKAFDDRIGCFMLLEILRKAREIPVNIIGVFSIQEEVGLRGARALSMILDADYAIALESTAAADTPGIPEYDYSTRLGRGPAITIADKAAISHPGLVRLLVNIAKRDSIPYQFKGRMVGGTDASAYQYVRRGIPSTTISVPSRYIHTACSVADISDIENSIRLVLCFLRHIAGKDGI